jgi:dihydrodipicolinate synthase/N-acetylneuraminate lyase
MTPHIVVPALNPPTRSTGIDRPMLRAYAARAAATWVDAFLLSGSTTGGHALTVEQRGAVIDLWLEQVPPSRLIACCWRSADITEARRRGVPAMAVLRELPDRRRATAYLADLPAGTYVYSHPRYTSTVFDAELARTADRDDVLPAGGKMSKTDLPGIAALRAATGTGFALWDGSSRHIEASVRAGADGVVATPLSPFAEPFPARDIDALQAWLDAAQADLDALPDRARRAGSLVRQAFPDR